MILRHRRRGFTLLEVMLATSIGIMLLGAVYVAVETQLRQAQAAREIVERSTLARALLTRIENDISSTINLCDPGRFRNQQTASASAAGGTSGTGAGATGAAATGATGATGAAGTTSTTGSSNVTTISIPEGLIGDSETLNLYMTRLPPEAIKARATDTPPAVSDTRRISYWLIQGDKGGLAKQEVGPITSDDALINLPPTTDTDNPNTKILSEEVQSLTFSYWDGANWNDTWDSTMLGADGVTPLGPPLAVAIEIGLPARSDPDSPIKIYRHVVSLVTANGATPQPTTTGTTNTTTGGGTSP
jgi:prepilin-type N-terminal cleavage/methylation domain-containing protein